MDTNASFHQTNTPSSLLSLDILYEYKMRIRQKKNLNFARIAKRNMNFWANQKNTKLSLTFELINNIFADLPI